MTTWTVVYRTSKFASTFRQTGFVGTWEEATEEARRMWNEMPELTENSHVYYVPSDAATVEHEGADGIVTAVKIAPTKEQKAAAARRQAAIDTIVTRHHARLAESFAYSPVMGFGGRLHGIIDGEVTPESVAAYAVDNGMTWDDISRTQW